MQRLASIVLAALTFTAVIAVWAANGSAALYMA